MQSLMFRSATSSIRLLIYLKSHFSFLKIEERYRDDIEASYENDIEPTELENSNASLHNIKRETSAAYTNLCTWKTSKTRSQAIVNKDMQLLLGPSR